MAFGKRFLYKRWLWVFVFTLVFSQSHTQFIVAQEAATSNAEDITIQAETSSGNYLSGEIITITGVVYAKPGLLFSTPVKSILTFADQTGTFIGATTSDIHGYFRIPIYLASSPTLISRAGRNPKITIKAVPFEKSLFKDGSKTIKLKSPQPESFVTTLMIDKAVYDFDEAVAVTGMLLQNGRPVKGPVTIRMDDVLIASVSTDPAGRYSSFFTPALKYPPEQLSTEQTTYHRLSVTPGTATDEQTSGPGAYFILLGLEANCIAGEVKAIQVTGKPGIIPLIENAGSLINDPVIKTGDLLAPNSIVKTYEGDRLSLEIPVTDGIVNIGLNPQSNARLVSCREKSGKERIRIILNNPSQALMDITNSSSKLVDIRLLTPGAIIQGAGSRGFVTLDEQGMTTIVALTGSLYINDYHGSSLDLQQGTQVTLEAGESVITTKPSLQSIDMDPALEIMVASQKSNFLPGEINLLIAGAILSILLFGVALALWHNPGLTAPLSSRVDYARQSTAASIKGLYKKKPIHDQEVTACLLIQNGNDAPLWIGLTRNGLTIGREFTNRFQLKDLTIAPPHARFVLENDNWIVTDLNSAHGTFVNGVRIKSYVLRNRDQINMGDLSTIFLQKIKKNGGENKQDNP